jgi:hypothetical protein
MTPALGHAQVDLSALVEGICQDAYDAGEPVTAPRTSTSLTHAVGRRRIDDAGFAGFTA